MPPGGVGGGAGKRRAVGWRDDPGKQHPRYRVEDDFERRAGLPRHEAVSRGVRRAPTLVARTDDGHGRERVRRQGVSDALVGV